MPLVNIEGVDLFFCEGGNGDIPLLLLPGLATDSSCWGGCYSAWLKDFHLIMPDFRGTGQTPVGTLEIDFELYADDLASILRHLKLEKVHLLGHSMGGMIAQVFADKYPLFVDKLILASSSPRSTPFASQVVRSWRRIKELGTPEDFFNAVLPWMVTRKYFENQTLCAGAVKYFLAYPYKQTTENFIKQLVALRGFDFTNSLKNIDAETLVICGEHDLMFSLDEQKEFCRLIKKARLEILKDTAHSPLLENGQIFSRKVRDFLLDERA